MFTALKDVCLDLTQPFLIQLLPRLLMQKTIYLLLFLLWPLSVFTQHFFEDLPSSEVIVAEGTSMRRFPQCCRWMRLDLGGLQRALHSVPNFSAGELLLAEPFKIALPLPDGQWATFRLLEWSVLAPPLQARYPDLRSYSGRGIEDPTVQVKCELTPHGFFAMILGRQGTTFIDTYRQGQDAYVAVYAKEDAKSKKTWTCSAGHLVYATEHSKETRGEPKNDCLLRTYRLALACTGEYAQYHGGTKASALAAMVTTLNRVNGVFERDLGIRMELVANNDTLIFLNPATDGYSNGDPFAMLAQNAAKCNALIGSANYDIGHVFGTGDGGVAGLGVACNPTAKAYGATGLSLPIGDPFDIDYVAHEFGHQFGANHTQNNSCNRNDATALEPGSGSTIMGYAGICSPNIQANSDDYFHAISIQEIRQYTAAGEGNTCPQKIDLGNTAPTVTVVGKSIYFVPRATPFALTAIGSDPDGDLLTYCWEQMDTQIAPMPPRPTNIEGPMFRSRKPTLSPTRYFPALEHVLSSTVNPWERLPAVSRRLHFRVTVRDQHPGGGCTADADAEVVVDSSAGPFTLLEPNLPLTWYAGEIQTVRWNVANTNDPPIQCNEVLILLSIDGGWTYSHLLAGPVPNNGEAQVAVPYFFSDSCRIRIQAADNIFFDVSDHLFQIEMPPTPSFLLQTSLPDVVQKCLGDTLSFWVKVLPIAGFAQEVILSVKGLPANIEPNPVVPGDSARITLAPLYSPGMYSLQIVGATDSTVREQTITLHVDASSPSTPTPNAPEDGRRNVLPSAALTWNASLDAAQYFVQVAKRPSFDATAITWEAFALDTSASPIGIQAGEVYYWRVRAENACGHSAFSPVWAFQVTQSTCGFDFSSTDVPRDVSDGGPSVVSSSLNLADDRLLSDVDVWLNIRHTWVGDLRARLIGPDGSSCLLFDQPGVPDGAPGGCSGDDLLLSFDDSAALSAAHLEATCQLQPPAIAGTFQPIEPLAAFNKKAASGLWRLEVSDLEELDGGQIESWGLRACFWDTVPAPLLLKNEVLLVPSGKAATIDQTLLALEIGNLSPESGLFTLLSLPEHGQLLLNGVPLGIGSIFTQADVDSGIFRYVHDGSAALSDAFTFDAYVVPNGYWLHRDTFSIQIVPNDLVVALELVEAVRCAGDTSGRLLVTVQGGKPPYSYQLNGPLSTTQDNGLFEHLKAGVYFVIVTDGWGFTASSAPLVVPEPDSIAVQVVVAHDSIWVQASGGTPPYTYRLGEGDFQEEPFFAGMPNGTYTVEVKDSQGCLGSTTTIVYVGPLAVLRIQVKEPLCFGGSDGSVQITAGGGLPPYIYSLDSINFQSQNTFEHLPAGNYTVWVVDRSGTTAVDSFTVEAPPPLVLIAHVVLNRIEVSAHGGTGSLLYRLNDGAFQSEPTFTQLLNGTYTVTVRDANGCTADTLVTVDVPPLEISPVEIEGEIRCSGETVRVTVRASGGVPPYLYSLDGGPFQPDSTWAAVGGGQHIVIVRDAAGNELSSAPFVIAAPDPLHVLAVVLGPTVSLVPSGGTPPYQYALNGAYWTSDSLFSNLPNGSYFVLAADAYGCLDTVSFDIDYQPMTLLVTHTDPTCSGASDGRFEVEILGGVPPFYCDGQLLSDRRCARDSLSAGLYSIAVVDALGDTLHITLELTAPDPIEVSASAVADTLIATATGGTPPLSYSLNGVHFQSAPIFPNLPNGIYTVTVQDAYGCTATSDPVLIDIIRTQSLAREIRVYLYPNPSDGRFWVRIPAEAAGEWELALYNAQGIPYWWKACWLSSDGVLYDADVPEGAYVLWGRSAIGQFAERIIVLRSP